MSKKSHHFLTLWPWTLTYDLEKLIRSGHYHYQCVYQIWEQSIPWFLSYRVNTIAGGGRLRRKTITSPHPSDTGDIIRISRDLIAAAPPSHQRPVRLAWCQGGDMTQIRKINKLRPEGSHNSSACQFSGYSFQVFSREYTELPNFTGFQSQNCIKITKTNRPWPKSTLFWRWSGYICMPNSRPSLLCVLLKMPRNLQFDLFH